MAIETILKQLVNGEYSQFAPVEVSTGAGDGGKVAVLNQTTGRWDLSLIPVEVGLDVVALTAFENISAGQYVHVFSDGGTPSVRLATAAGPGYLPAHGWAVETKTATNTIKIAHEGNNPFVAGLTVGLRYALSAVTPGGVIPASGIAAGIAAGDIIQFVSSVCYATSGLLWPGFHYTIKA